MNRKNIITVKALRIIQRKDIPIFVFGIEGRLVHQIATISGADRTDDGILIGYQRTKVEVHISEILNYLSQGTPLLPNAIVIAFDTRVKFSAIKGEIPSEWGTFGELEIPIPKNISETKVGWIVDGQQRVTALSKLKPGNSFPVVVVGFQSASEELQREQFLLVNKTKPLPKDLLNEILPEINAPLSKKLEQTRLATKVVQKLRFSVESPFYRRIKGLGMNNETANISQAAILAIIQNNIRRKGILFDCIDGKNQNSDIDRITKVLTIYFNGVKRTWLNAWMGNPKTSRLVHGVGLVALGHLLDRVMQDINTDEPRASVIVQKRLNKIKDKCAWTSGRWESIGCAWNELQNTSQDKARLTDYLLREYRSTKV